METTKIFKKNYPCKHRKELRDLSKKIFESLEELINEHKDFKLIKKDYTKKVLFCDWNITKGKLIYNINEEARLKIKFRAAYPFLTTHWENGYIQIKTYLYINKPKNFEEKIFDELKTKIYYLLCEKEGKNEKEKENGKTRS